MLDGRMVEALFEIFERGFYILSVALAWGCHVEALSPKRELTTQGIVRVGASGTPSRRRCTLSRSPSRRRRTPSRPSSRPAVWTHLHAGYGGRLRRGRTISSMISTSSVWFGTAAQTTQTIGTHKQTIDAETSGRMSPPRVVVDALSLPTLVLHACRFLVSLADRPNHLILSPRG